MIPSRINSSIRLWKGQLPTVSPYYAVKCNPAPIFLNYLFDRGIHFDCASERELLEVQSLARGTLPSRVVYANPCKSGRDLLAAQTVGSPITVVDSPEEVEKLADVGYKGGAFVRLAVDDTGSIMPFSTKFGAPISMVEAIAGLAYRRSIPLKGVSFHVGSGCKEWNAYSKAIGEAQKAMSILQLHAHPATTIDIGGGFLPNEADFRMKAIHIRGALSNSISWIAEPGRFFAANSFDFFVEVIGKKRGPNKGWMYTLDDSMYGQFSNILYDHAKPVWHRVPLENEPAKRKFSAGTLFGRTCDSLDMIARCSSMEELEVGDWLRFPRMGAYTRATASEFNGFPTPEIMYLHDVECAAYEEEDSEFRLNKGQIGHIQYHEPISLPSVTPS
jgi:ornithine decarboxylase